MLYAIYMPIMLLGEIPKKAIHFMPNHSLNNAHTLLKIWFII